VKVCPQCSSSLAFNNVIAECKIDTVDTVIIMLMMNWILSYKLMKYIINKLLVWGFQNIMPGRGVLSYPGEYVRRGKCPGGLCPGIMSVHRRGPWSRDPYIALRWSGIWWITSNSLYQYTFKKTVTACDFWLVCVLTFRDFIYCFYFVRICCASEHCFILRRPVGV